MLNFLNFWSETLQLNVLQKVVVVWRRSESEGPIEQFNILFSRVVVSLQLTLSGSYHVLVEVGDVCCLREYRE